jgi:hypothetical protein
MNPVFVYYGSAGSLSALRKAYFRLSFNFPYCLSLLVCGSLEKDFTHRSPMRMGLRSVASCYTACDVIAACRVPEFPWTVGVWASYRGRDGSRSVCRDTVTARDKLRQLDALLSSLLSELAQVVRLLSCIPEVPGLTSAGTQTLLTTGIRSFPQSLKAIARIVFFKLTTTVPFPILFNSLFANRPIIRRYIA